MKKTIVFGFILGATTIISSSGQVSAVNGHSEFAESVQGNGDLKNIGDRKKTVNYHTSGQIQEAEFMKRKTKRYIDSYELSRRPMHTSFNKRSSWNN